MSRPFSAMTPQQAPAWPIARQAALSGWTTALSTAQSTSGGSSRTSSASTMRVPSVFFQSLNRLRLSHGSTPSVATGGGRLGIATNVVLAELIVPGSPRGGCTSS